MALLPLTLAKAAPLALVPGILLALCWRPALAADAFQEDVNASLIYAAGRGDMTSFNLALALGASLNAVDRQGNNAVLTATEGEQYALLRQLLDKGVNPDARGASGFTALGYGALHGLDRAVALLLKAGADPNRPNAAGSTPLHLAAEFGHDDIIAALVRAGAAVDAVNGAGETALIAAIRANRPRTFAALLALGARADVHDRAGRSALFWAILEDHEAMALALVEKGVRCDAASDGYTPLQMARIMGHATVVAALARRGAGD